MTTIAEGSARTTIDGQPVALHGHRCACGARWSALTQTAGLISEAVPGIPVRRRATARYGRWLSARPCWSCLAAGSRFTASSEGKRLAATGILLALVLAGTGWLIRLLYYRMSVHNAKFYDQLVAYEQQQWWAEHRQPIGLQEGLLLGPMGKTTTDWLRVLSRHQRPPEEENEGGGRAASAILSVSEAIAREKRLAELLVMEWQRQRSERTLTPPLRCYWQERSSRQAFRAQMTLTVAQMTLPSRPYAAWGGQPRGDARSGGS